MQKMWILPEVAMCTETGKPHAWKTDTNEKVQDLSILDVEEPYRRFLILTEQDCNLRIFQNAVDNVCVTSLELMIEHFPEWIDEDDRGRDCCDMCSDGKNPGWSKEEHTQFKEALDYLAKKGIAYRVEW